MPLSVLGSGGGADSEQDTPLSEPRGGEVAEAVRDGREHRVRDRRGVKRLGGDLGGVHGAGTVAGAEGAGCGIERTSHRGSLRNGGEGRWGDGKAGGDREPASEHRGQAGSLSTQELGLSLAGIRPVEGDDERKAQKLPSPEK